VSLIPHLNEASFTGTVSINAVTSSSTTEIVLNSIELQIHSVAVNGVPALWSLHEPSERLIITTDSPLDGEITIVISFTGILNDKLHGFYRSTFIDSSGIERTIATTQMQSTDCRRAFPCFDEPDLKAVFSIDMIIDDGLLAISNGSERSRESLGDGTTRVWFSDTMIMSTYLVAFVVGPLEATPPVEVNGVPVRVIHVPGKAHLAEFGLRAATFSLDWFQTYYGIAYPSDKVDLVALPDFAMGAMENVGCITFREVLLLVDPATSTQVEQELVAAVVSHELAHMWFGDLVTMKWWNGIWLNEAFATFMEVAATDAFAPEWKMWTSFGLDRSAAFEVDSLHNTRTVEFPVNSPEDSEGMFDVLTYQKGGALLRMLEQYLGPDRFRAGVSHYLTIHSYKNTETNDLWDAIEHIVSTDGGPLVPVRALMDSWIWQAGYPLINASIEGAELVLSQRQFSFDNTPDATVWVVPIHIRIGHATTKILLEKDAIRIALDDPSATVVVNAGGPGFYRVSYSQELLERITDSGLGSLDVLERYNLVDDAWSSVVAGALSSAQFLDFAKNFSNDRDLAVWQALAIGLRGTSRLLSRDKEPAFARYIVALVSPALGELGWDPQQEEAELTSKLRGLLIQLLAINGQDLDAQTRCRNILFNKTHTDPELVAAATNVVAATGDEQDYEWFLTQFRSPSTPQEQIRMLYALTDFDSAELITKTCELAFTDEVKTQNAPFVLSRCISNRHHGELAWSFVRSHWAQSNEKFPSNTIIRMVSETKNLNTPSLQADVQAFFSEHPIPRSGKTLDQVLERQRVNVSLRAREETRLAEYLLR